MGKKVDARFPVQYKGKEGTYKYLENVDVKVLPDRSNRLHVYRSYTHSLLTKRISVIPLVEEAT